MDVCVLTENLIFYSAVEGVSGAMGLDIADLASRAEPMRIAFFAHGHDPEMIVTARRNGIAHVYRRGKLAEELPRILGEYA